jgi:aspartate 1-decarboxylase
MFIEKLRAKIHRATVTDANLNYVGSITIDSELLALSGIDEYEKVQVVNITNGQRFETYVIEGEAGSGAMCLNGACARLAEVGDKVIVMAYGFVDYNESSATSPKLVFVNDRNEPVAKSELEA